MWLSAETVLLGSMVGRTVLVAAANEVVSAVQALLLPRALCRYIRQAPSHISHVCQRPLPSCRYSRTTLVNASLRKSQDVFLKMSFAC